MILRRVLLFSALAASPVLAERVPGGDVRVERAEHALDCPAQTELVAAALALGSTPGAAPAGSNIVVRFERDGSAYRALIRSSGQKTGERELRTDDADCRRLADAVSVVVAVLLDIVPADAVASFEAAPPAMPQIARPPAPAPEKTVTAPPGPARLEPPDVHTPFALSLRAEVALSVGLLGAAVSPTFGGSAAVTRGPWQAALGGFWVVPRDVPFDPLSGTAVHVSLALGTADGCYRFAGGTTRAWETWICARFLAGVIGGDGRGFDHHYPTHEPWFGAGPVFTLRLPLSRAFALRFGASGVVTLGDHTFRVEDYGDAFESPPLSAALSIGPELTIW